MPKTTAQVRTINPTKDQIHAIDAETGTEIVIQIVRIKNGDVSVRLEGSRDVRFEKRERLFPQDCLKDQPPR